MPEIYYLIAMINAINPEPSNQIVFIARKQRSIELNNKKENLVKLNSKIR